MTQTHNAQGLNTLTEAAPSEDALKAKPDANGLPEKPDEPDDSVEALIIPMDRTTAEHLFLQAQQHLQREASHALVDADH